MLELEQGSANLSVKGQRVNMLVFPTIWSLSQLLYPALTELKQPWAVHTFMGVAVSQYNFVYGHYRVHFI